MNLRQDNITSEDKKKIAKNITYLMRIMLLLFLILLGRYFYLQVLGGENYRLWLHSRVEEEVEIQSPRGSILDREGRMLAVSVLTKSLFIDPNSVKKGEAEDIASSLAPLIGWQKEDILACIAKGGGFVWLKHHLSNEEVLQVKALLKEKEWICLGFKEEAKRYYPNDSLLSNVLGFVGTEDRGLEGIEAGYDEALRGNVKKEKLFSDLYNQPIFESIFSFRRDLKDERKNIRLTIDNNIQFIVEEALDETLATTKAKALTALVMNPKTGEILAMASRPTFNPNHFASYNTEAWKNRAVSVVYEPGSTFKAIVLGAALEENLITPNETFVDPGVVVVEDRQIQNWNGESVGTVTYYDVVKKSLNTGFVKIGQALGAKRLINYAKNFGFGEYTGIELAGEEKGILLDPEKMVPSDIATVAIGQSIAVTPVQLIAAMGAIANDGILMRPYIVKAIENADGTIEKETTPKEVRRVLTSAVDQTTVGMLEQVVETGGGKKARVEGYRIAGKTGTAEKTKEGELGYLKNHYIASFCGFAPVEKPEVVVLVIIDDPLGDYYGGQIAAPVAGDIFAKLFRYLQIEPSELREEGKIIVREEKETNTTLAIVPDVRGLSKEEVQLRLNAAQLKLKAKGEGFAIKQNISPSKLLPKGSEIIVEFQND